VGFPPQGGGGGVTPELLDSGTLTADGNEQNLINRTAEGIETIWGWVSINNMQANDAVTVRTRVGGVIHATELYEDSPTQPMLYFPKRTLNEGEVYRATLEQTAGVNRDYDYEFFMEG